MATMLNVREVAGTPFCTFPDDGDRVYEAVRCAWEAGGNVRLSFAAVQDLTSMFLNAAVGRLYGEHDYAEVDRRIEAADLEPHHALTWRRCTERAKAYFNDPARHERAHRRALDLHPDAH